MYEGKSVAVVVPAYNEEALIASTVSTIPAFVDRIIVVDDGSNDDTVEKARNADPRVDLIVHERNQGVGAAAPAQVCSGQSTSAASSAACRLTFG